MLLLLTSHWEKFWGPLCRSEAETEVKDTAAVAECSFDKSGDRKHDDGSEERKSEGS